MKFLLMFVVLAVLVAGLLYLGYRVGRSRASEWDKTRNEQYKQAIEEHRKQVEVNIQAVKVITEYKSALESIATGRGASPEITAKAALMVADKEIG